MSNSSENLEHVVDRASLQEGLSFMAIYIGLYEAMKDTMLSRVEAFLCPNVRLNEESKLVYEHSDLYKKEIKKRIINGKVSENRLVNTMHWLEQEGAITQEELERFEQIRELRHSYAHEMTEHIWRGVSDEEVSCFTDAVKL